MAGVEQENGKAPRGDVEEDEMSEDGSVDIEGESEEELEEEEEEGKGEGAEGAEEANGDAMEVDVADKADKPAPTPANQPVTVAS
jgi:histone chaperone ASF1